MSNFITRSEAEKAAVAMRQVPDVFLEKAKSEIVKSMAAGLPSCTISKPRDMNAGQWHGFQEVLKNNGWQFKIESDQREGDTWVRIAL